MPWRRWPPSPPVAACPRRPATGPGDPGGAKPAGAPRVHSPHRAVVSRRYVRVPICRYISRAGGGTRRRKRPLLLAGLFEDVTEEDQGARQRHPLPLRRSPVPRRPLVIRQRRSRLNVRAWGVADGALPQVREVTRGSHEVAVVVENSEVVVRCGRADQQVHG
jgi:hypothetical protein